MKKEAFLRVKRGKEYNTTKVSDFCREAEISRGTFYAHFSNISEVLDVLLNEALSNMDYLLSYISVPDAGAEPCCQKKLAELYKDGFVRAIRGEAGSLLEKEAEALFYFQINGCYAVSKWFSNLANLEWCPIQDRIDHFIKACK